MKRAKGVGVTLAAGLVLAVAALLPGTALADDDSSVVVTRPGVVFHKVGSGDVRGRGHEKSLENALAAGYTPCKICFGKDLSVDVRAAGAGSSAANGGYTGRGVVFSTSTQTVTVSQPFGLRGSSGRGIRGASKAIPNPYTLCHVSLRFPGLEQGAYGGNN